MAATSLPWAPPGYPSYTGYTSLSIGNANKSSLASLTAGTDYKITFTEQIVGSTLGSPALQILGGRNIVVIGLDVVHSATQQTTTITGALTTGSTQITLASNTGFSAGNYVVVDPGVVASSEGMRLDSLASGTTWNVTRDTGWANGGVAGGSPVAHSSGATVKRVGSGPNWGIQIQDWTGTMHLEGVYGHGTSLSQGIYQQNPTSGSVASQDVIIQVQNCHFDAHADDVRNGNDNHADAWQVAAGVAEQRVGWSSFRSTSNGLQWQPHDQDANLGVRPRLWDLRNVDVAGSTFHAGQSDGSRHLWYTNAFAIGDNTKSSGGFGPRRGWEINTENLYMQPASGRTSNYVRWANTDNHEILLEKVTQGTPAGGPYCPTTVPGASYTSPGYDTTVSAPILGRERGFMAANQIRGLTKRTLSATGQQVQELRAFVQMANYRRAVMEATPGFYARLRETAGTSVAEEPMWGWGAATSANATLNTVSSPIADGGPAYGFNGTSASVSKAFDLSSTGYKVDQLTLMAFVYVDTPALGADQVIVEHTTNFGSNQGGLLWEVVPAGTGHHRLALRTTAVGFTQADFPVSTTAGWHHMVGQIDRTLTVAGGQFRFYLDGSPVTATATSGTAAHAGLFDNATMYLMSRAGASLFTAGRMAEFAWFPRILAADEIAHIYAQSQIASATATMRMVAYKDPTATASSLIGVSDELVVSAGQRGKWMTFPFTTPPAIPNGDFWTGVFGGTGAAGAAVARTAGSATDGGVEGSLTYPTAPTSFTADSFDQFAYNETLSYATQTVAPSSTGWLIGVGY